MYRFFKHLYGLNLNTFQVFFHQKGAEDELLFLSGEKAQEHGW